MNGSCAVSVIYNICEDWDLDFVGMFACTGLWNSFFLLIYAFTDASNLMKWCTRSVLDAHNSKLKAFLADRTARGVINYWHHNVVCLSVRLTVTLCVVTLGTRFYNFQPPIKGNYIAVMEHHVTATECDLP